MEGNLLYKKPFFIYSIDLLIFLICSLGVLFTINKADLPFKLDSPNNYLIITHSNTPEIEKGNIILKIEDKHFSLIEEVEVYLDQKSINNKVNISYLKNNIIHSAELELVPYYSNIDVIINSIVGFIFILLGLFVIVNKPENKGAVIFHWSSMFTAMVILLTPGDLSNYQTFAFLCRILFYATYSFIPSMFIHFTYAFPQERTKENKETIRTFYILSSLFSILLTALFLTTLNNAASSSISRFIKIYDIFRVFVSLGILFSTVNFIKSYITAKTQPERKKLKWILLGFVIGPISYIIFWVIPYLFFHEGLIPLAWVMTFLIAIPVTFTISILKYHVLDIDFVINRGLVYFTAILSFMVFYFGILNLLSIIIAPDSTLIPTAAAIASAFFFNKTKTKIQKIVDVKIFKVQYEFKKAYSEYLHKIRELKNIDEVLELLKSSIIRFIPVDKIYMADNFDQYKAFDKVYADKDKIEHDVDFYISKEKQPVLTAFIKSDGNDFYGSLNLGMKLSGYRFTKEDIDLILSFVTTSANTIKKITLQDELIKKQLEAEKLEELNKMKSLFISSVSHDLKTPVTSIKMFSEMLFNNVNDETSKEYLKIIDGESLRLTRLIDNVLSFSKIESGITKYNFTEFEFNSFLNELIKSIMYSIEMNNFTLNFKLSSDFVIINGDKNALEEAILNLIYNSIKYSKKLKILDIFSETKDETLYIKVKDNGIGISEEDLEHIFTPYYRGRNTEFQKGTGIGLSIVKHIIDSHKGTIDIKSSTEEGTSVTIKLPILKIIKGEMKHEEYFNN